jgi:hypothetical protein
MPLSRCPSLTLHPRHAVPLMQSLPRLTPPARCPSHAVTPSLYTPATLSLSCCPCLTLHPATLSLSCCPSLTLHPATLSLPCPTCCPSHAVPPSPYTHHRQAVPRPTPPMLSSLASHELLWLIVSVIRPLSYTLCTKTKHLPTSVYRQFFNLIL